MKLLATIIEYLFTQSFMMISKLSISPFPTWLRTVFYPLQREAMMLTCPSSKKYAYRFVFPY
jgi:hypothetical protein